MQDTRPGILLDANLLILLVVGRFDRRLIGHKRLDVYTGDDYKLLHGILDRYSRNLTTPHLLTEVSNLSDQVVPKPRHRAFRQFLAMHILPFLEEHWAPANELSQTDEFRRLGLGDAAICQLADEQIFVLSVDAELCSTMWGRGLNVENFNHLRCY